MKDQDWWRGSVTYQIYPRSFQDSTGNGIGDLAGITSRLDYIADLGVDAIWLSPFFTSPQKDMGYDVSDYVNIDPLFGSLEDFDKMVTRAHELGLKVIIDQVISHSSDQHPFFEESRSSRDNPKADWYVWADANPDGTPPNNWRAVFGGSAWQWDTRRKQYYLHNFLREQPDFNMHNPEVQDYLLSTMRFWLERGVDGFRLDTVNFYFHDDQLRDNPAYPDVPEHLSSNPYYYQNPIRAKNQPENIAFLERLRALTDEFDARTMVGEVGEHVQALELMAEYTTGQRLHMAYSFGMLGFDFSPKFYREQITEFFQKAPKGWPCWAFSNHDVIRHVSRFMPYAKEQDAIAKLCAALLLSLQGSICLYQGEELGLTETELSFDELQDPQGIEFWPADKGRDGCRTPMVWEAELPYGGFSETQPWLPVKAPQLARAADTQIGHSASVLEFYRAMLELRRENAELRTGETEFLETSDSILAFRRGEHTLCMFNLSADKRAIDLPKGTILMAEGYSETELAANGFAILAV